MQKSLLRTNKELAEIYARHVNTVYRVCFAFLKNAADTEDMVQNTFIKLIDYDGELLCEEHIKAWLIVTASNLCKDFLRHWWRKREDISEHEELPDERAQTFEIDETLEAVMSLPDKLKTSIYMYYYEGYTSVEISKLLKKPQSTVRNYLHKGRELLRKKLGGEFDEEQTDN
jgi:RNA polymerase sigma-70 factor (ECF subfamily)